MKQLILAFFLICLASPALALTQSEYNELSASGQAAVMQAIADSEAAASAVPKSAKEVEEWVRLVDAVGQGLGQLAKELGVQANELLNTPVGYITVGLIAYNVMGNDLMGIFLGLLWLGLTVPFWLLWFVKVTIPVVSYKEVKKSTLFRGVVTCDVPVRRKPDFEGDAGPEWVSLVTMVLMLFTTLIFIS